MSLRSSSAIKRTGEAFKIHHSPEKASALLAPAQTASQTLLTCRLVILSCDAINVVKAQLLTRGYLFGGKKRQVMYVLVRMISHSCKNAHVGLAGVVDEAGGARHEFAVNLEGIPSEPVIEGIFVGKFIEREKVDVFPSGLGAPAIRLRRRDDFAKIAINKLTLLDGFWGANA